MLNNLLFSIFMISYLIIGIIINKLKRRSKQREAILNFLRKTNSHPTADQIYDEVRKEIPKISKGTVYRNLRVLSGLGLVSELYLNGTVSRFEAKRENHYHFRCEKCGSVFDIDQLVDKELEVEVSRRTGLKILYHLIEFYGTCPNCLDK